jgi:hypothetical protein
MEGPMPGEAGIALEEEIERHHTHQQQQDSSNSSATDLEKAAVTPTPVRTVHGFKVFPYPSRADNSGS